MVELATLRDSMWSTDTTISPSTESLPVTGPLPRNRVIPMRESASAPTITSSIWRRIRTGIAGLEGVGSPSNPQSYKWVKSVAEGFTP